ncbi:uncharacterized protein G2W53_019555 [Senna tora]|uniref:Uncharacterized protein n=1 Tax=Senna tora TaxID=362788 RepID=A0A834TX66_9FABA|nr:uncharacterized protein G2W53_019555 [Senna tora]
MGASEWTKLKEVDRKTDPSKWADKVERNWSGEPTHLNGRQQIVKAGRD